MSREFIFSSESVTEGHPDKVADTISDYILDRCLENDPASRVACETLVKDNMVVLAGEITTNSKFNYQSAVYEAIKEIGYTYDDCAFHAEKFVFINALGQQSNDIAQGVDADEAQQIGMVSKVVPQESLLEECYAIAERINGFSQLGVELSKQMLWAGLDAGSLHSHMNHEGHAQLFMRMTTKNFEEAIKARKEGRSPDFKD